jgi:dTDP-4-amino-4,6-dideoxygalactose transaminase
MTGAELELVKEAFASNWIAPLGPHVNAFEEEMCKKLVAGSACALSSGTGALHLALLLLDVKRDDDVWCSSLTFAATANAITYVGASPVFVDSDLVSWNMDPLLLAEALEGANKANKLPKAIIVVDLYGQCADYDAILAACNKYDVPVIEDSAEALGATYKGSYAGTFGQFAIMSFNGNKMITTSGGGMLLSPDKGMIARALHLATQARDPAPHYQHSKVGYNYRMSNVLAAIGRGQLVSLDDKVAARRDNFDKYFEALGSVVGFSFMPEAEYGRCSRWLSCLTIDHNVAPASTDTIRESLAKKNIECRPVWKPMHLQPVFKGCRMIGGSVSEKLFEQGLCLPSGSSLTDDELQYVVDSIQEVLKK